VNKFIKNVDIDHRAEELISRYEQISGLTVKPPVPIEQILLQSCKLYVAWDEIEENDDYKILGGLSPLMNTIVLNTLHKDLFENISGLERSTIGHEAGHWEYDIDKGSIGQPQLFDVDKREMYLRSISKKYGEITIYRSNRLPSSTRPTKSITDRLIDTPDQSRIVNRFAGALNMPNHLISEAIKQNDISSWPNLYKLREKFDVSISALTVRLQQLNYIYLEGKKIHRSKAEALGQETLGF